MPGMCLLATGEDRWVREGFTQGTFHKDSGKWVIDAHSIGSLSRVNFLSQLVLIPTTQLGGRQQAKKESVPELELVCLRPEPTVTEQEGRPDQRAQFARTKSSCKRGPSCGVLRARGHSVVLSNNSVHKVPGIDSSIKDYWMHKQDSKQPSTRSL